MSEQELDEVLTHVGVDRRTFVKRIVLGTAFAVPVVASFEMDSLAAAPAVRTPNGIGRQHLSHRYAYHTRHHGRDTHVDY
jgi:hypothetical protein